MTILVVDDSSVMRKIVIRSLRQAGYGDHDVVEAEDGAQALESIRSSPPDVVLSDWNMPNMSGLELVTALRAEGNKKLPLTVGQRQGDDRLVEHVCPRCAGGRIIGVKQEPVDVGPVEKAGPGIPGGRLAADIPGRGDADWVHWQNSFGHITKTLYTRWWGNRAGKASQELIWWMPCRRLP